MELLCDLFVCQTMSSTATRIYRFRLYLCYCFKLSARESYATHLNQQHQASVYDMIDWIDTPSWSYRSLQPQTGR